MATAELPYHHIRERFPFASITTDDGKNNPARVRRWSRSLGSKPGLLSVDAADGVHLCVSDPSMPQPTDPGFCPCSLAPDSLFDRRFDGRTSIHRRSAGTSLGNHQVSSYSHRPRFFSALSDQPASTSVAGSNRNKKSNSLLRAFEYRVTAGLICYPFVIQQVLTLQQQTFMWKFLFYTFAILCVLSSLQAIQLHSRERTDHQNTLKYRTSPTQFLWWLFLSAVPCASLIAYTNVLTLDTAPAPFIWVLPFATYLITLIIAFGETQISRGIRYHIAALVTVTVTALCYRFPPSFLPLSVDLIIAISSVFFVCLLFHRELVRRQPKDSSQIPYYYLTMSLGGAIGGISVAILPPLIFNDLYEFGIVLIICTTYACLSMPDLSQRVRTIVSITCLVVVTSLLVIPIDWNNRTSVLLTSARDFYGVNRIYQLHSPQPQVTPIMMLNGAVRHGLQVQGPGMSRTPLLYYHEKSGIGLAIEYARQKFGNLRIGVVGLGCGTLAAYGQPSDYIRFYEISPLVESLARQHFTYLKDCPAEITTVSGDARISLNIDQPQKFDLLVVDAFSGDSIPLHLMTEEAVEIYRRHLHPESMIAFHISNNSLDLTAPVEALARHSGMDSLMVVSPNAPAQGWTGARWVLCTTDKPFIQRSEQLGVGSKLPQVWERPWTDGTWTVLEVLK